MSYDSWTCLMVDRGPGMLAEEVRAALKMAACDLYLNRLERMRVATEVCSGYIETGWETHSVGARSGILFRTQIDCEQGDYHVNFLLSVGDLERGAGRLRDRIERGEYAVGTSEERFPCEALYEFHDLGERYRRSLN